MNDYEIRNYFTLSDLIRNALQEDELPESYYFAFYPISTSYNLKAILNNLFLDFPASSKAISNKGEELWDAYIAPKYLDQYVIYIDTADDEEVQYSELLKAYKNWIRKYLDVFSQTFEKYDILISGLTAKRTNLLDQVKSNGVSRFNDTPQNSGSFADDTHSSNITQTEDGTDYATPIERLDEINRKIRNYYKDWANEFGRLFIEGGN